MGEVYKARDSALGRPVALKLLHSWADGSTDGLLHEARAQARVDHENVLKVFEAGEEEGRPFIVMQLVNGETLGQASSSMSIEQKVKVMHEVALGVHAAHETGLIHRDLKPGNILVERTPDGRLKPYVADFGLAREVLATGKTATGILVGTPEYMAPEQARGLKGLDRRTDVYSLGAMLYVILAGRPPFGAETGVDVVLRVLQEEPQPLRRIDPSLPADLETIVMKCLEKPRERRYESARALAEELQRYLKGEPISARKPTKTYRARMFVKRHWFGVSALSVILLMIIVFAFSAVLQARRLAKERDRAEKVSNFMVDLFKVSEPGPARGNAVTAREILDKGAERIRSELAGQPETQATLMGTIGRVYTSLGLYDQAVPLLEEALRLRQKTLPPDDPDIAASSLDLGATLGQKGDSRAAEGVLREALRIRRLRLGNQNVETARAMNILANVLDDLGELHEAETLYREALGIERHLPAGQQTDVPSLLNNLAGVSYDRGEYREAEVVYRELVEMDRRTLGEHDKGVAVDLNNLAACLAARDEQEEAQALYRQALEIDRQVFGNEHPLVADILYNIGETKAARGDYDAARKLYDESLALRHRVFGEENAAVAQSLAGLGQLLGVTGDLPQAEALLRRALDMKRKDFGNDHPNNVGILLGLAEVLTDRGDHGGAETQCREALRIASRSTAGSARTAECHLGLGRALLKAGRLSEAPGELEEAIGQFEKAFDPSHPELVHARALWARSLVASGRFEEAEKILLPTVALLTTRTGPKSRQTRDALDGVVTLYEEWKKPAKAIPFRERLR
jgi:tetratricopeptide (TPR) repeat protein